MRTQTLLIVLAGTILACVGVIVAILGLAEQNTTFGIVGLVAVVAVVVGTVLVYRRAMTTGRPQFEQAMATDFTASEHKWFDGSGLAIDTIRREVLLGTTKGTRRVPLDQIGPIAYQANRTGPAFSGSSPLALILFPLAIAAVVHNTRNAGLHVTAAGETIRIVGIQPKDAERWQTLLAPAASA